MQFEPLEQWIWLPEDEYPNCQNARLSCFSDREPENYCVFTVVKCEKRCTYHKEIASVRLRASADTFFRLHVNEVHVMTGPASVGGDFLGNDRVRPQHYATVAELDAEHPGLRMGELNFSAIVRLSPARMFEYSHGRGGFFLTAHIRFADGTKAILCTDETWQLTCLPAYTAMGEYDGARLPSEPVAAHRIANRWHCLTAPIPSCTEHMILPEGNRIALGVGESAHAVLPMDMIYTGYPVVWTKTDGRVEVHLRCVETDEIGTTEHYVFTHPDQYCGTALHSAGKLVVDVTNHSDHPAELTFGFLASHYPVTEQAVTRTSDAALNQVLDTCVHTLKYCRQTLHLDSGRHCEPLACTGDYYIESLMTAFSFGDMRLAAFDVRRTAQLLRYNDGRMFHTSYSLIWVQMLWDVYMYTGETQLLADCEDALTLLLTRFAGYLGENGIIENPPDYMFVDWLFPDGISTHHPPKALGQTCLNLFYFGALRTAAKVYDALYESTMSEHASRRADALQQHICELLYDKERGLFFEGLNTPTPEHLLGPFMPQNVEKRYYRQHANILAAYFGVLDQQGCCALLARVMSDDSLGVIQPYFAHFLLEAVYRCGLRDKYTLRILKAWKAPVQECPYGLAEGFHKPEPSYAFDHSHAWGGTPAYSLPLALSGLKILKPGFRKVRLKPALLGLDSAYVEIPTPYGFINIDLQKGKAPGISVPAAIELVCDK